jgi:Zn finger protein HypA/HybF involved in hydrogenase expression
MRIPFKIYELDDSYYNIKLNEIVHKHFYCPKCFSKSVSLRTQETLMSVIGFDVAEPVYFCSKCDKMIYPLTLDQMREEKINKIKK